MQNQPHFSTSRTRLPAGQHVPLIGFAVYHAFLLALLLFGRFNAYDLMLVFYIELIIIGFVALLRIAAGALFGDLYRFKHVEVSPGARLVLSVILAVFFISKYGLLMLGLGITILMLPGELGISWAEQTDLHPLVQWCFWLLILRYGISLVSTAFVRSEYHKESIISLLLYPYVKGIWLGVSIAVGFILASVYADQDKQLLFITGVFCARLIPDLIVLVIELRTARSDSVPKLISVAHR